MAHKQILLDPDVYLRLENAMLKRQIAQLQTQLSQLTAERVCAETVAQVLKEARIELPVPLSLCALDDEHGCLSYEVPDDWPSGLEPPAENALPN